MLMQLTLALGANTAAQVMLTLTLFRLTAHAVLLLQRRMPNARAQAER
jgi:hypothetical protein